MGLVETIPENLYKIDLFGYAMNTLFAGRDYDRMCSGPIVYQSLYENMRLKNTKPTLFWVVM